MENIEHTIEIISQEFQFMFKICKFMNTPERRPYTIRLTCIALPELDTELATASFSAKVLSALKIVLCYLFATRNLL